MNWIVDNIGLILELTAIHLQQSAIAIVLGFVLSLGIVVTAVDSHAGRLAATWLRGPTSATSRTCSRNPSSRTTSSTALPTAMASGLPP